MCELQELFTQFEDWLRSGRISQKTVKAEVWDRIAKLMHDYPGIFISDDKQRVQEELWWLTWQEYFQKNQPPKYEWVKKSWKALEFFLKYYRGKRLDENNELVKCEDEDASKVDFVELWMTQVDLRKRDAKLDRWLRSRITYLQSKGKTTLILNELIPSLFRK